MEEEDREECREGGMEGVDNDDLEDLAEHLKTLPI